MCEHINSNEVLAENLRQRDTKVSYYLITIIKSQRKDHVTEGDLDSIYHILKQRLRTLQVLLHCYEVDNTYNQLHLHAIVSINQFFKYIHNNQINGFHIDWKPVNRIRRDFSTINAYLHKDACDYYAQEQILTINDYNSYYGFVDTI